MINGIKTKLAIAVVVVLAMSIEACAGRKQIQQNTGKGDFDIFLFIGQSNMAGHAKIEPLDTIPLKDVFLFNDKGEWEKAANTAKEGFNRYSSVKGKVNFLSQSSFFSKKLANYTSHTIGVVSNARGATTVSWWQKGYEGKNDFNLYEGALARAKAALATKPGTKLRGIIWHQGEGDNSEQLSKDYLTRLDKLVTDLRTDLGDPNIPFIAGEVGKWNGRGLGVNPQIRNIQSRISNSDWVSSDGLTSINQAKNDPHFDILSTRALGGRYADKAAELIYKIKIEGVTLFTLPDYEGRSVLLPAGSYSMTDLEGMGILAREISSAKIDKGYELSIITKKGRVSLNKPSPELEDQIEVVSIQVKKN